MGKLLKLECPACSNSLQIEEHDLSKFMFCGACGTKYFYELEPNATETDTLDVMMKRGIEHLELKNVAYALEIFTELTKKYPSNYRCWLGGALSNFLARKEVIPNCKLNAIKLAPLPIKVQLGALEICDEDLLTQLTYTLAKLEKLRDQLGSQNTYNWTPDQTLVKQMKKYRFYYVLQVTLIVIGGIISPLLACIGSNYIWSSLSGSKLSGASTFGIFAGILIGYCASFKEPMEKKTFEKKAAEIERILNSSQRAEFDRVERIEKKYVETERQIESAKEQITIQQGRKKLSYYLDILKDNTNSAPDHL